MDFEDDDPLVLIARICLGITVICMYPMLVNPARNILIQLFSKDEMEDSTLTQPLLDEDKDEETTLFETDSDSAISSIISGSSSFTLISDNSSFTLISDDSSTSSREIPDSLKLRIFCAILVLWNAAFIACFIQTLDVVWDFLGSSFSIIVGYLLPCGVYIYIRNEERGGLFWVAVLGVCIFTPMMVLCTVNSVYNSFF